MRLGYKSRIVLDFLLAAGADALAFCAFPTSALLQTGGWSEEDSFHRHLSRMRDNGWIVFDDRDENGGWVIRVTETGRSLVSDDIEPERAWARTWDGKWRMITFDLPAEARTERRELDLWLRKRRFGHLQGSVWIAPRFPEQWSAEVSDLKVDPTDISFLEGRSFARSSEQDFVKAAWDFQEINRRYQKHIRFLREVVAEPLKDWVAIEASLWRSAFETDPFLPDCLLPKGYMGKESYRLRLRVYGRALGDLDDCFAE